MWISKKLTSNQFAQTCSGLGVVSVGGTAPAVVSDGEQRQLQVASPGGYWWRPGLDSAVLVVEGTVVGAMADCPVTLAPGEVYLAAQGCSIHLKNNGQIAICGDLTINGQTLGGDTSGTATD